ncbi:MAG: diguanylate cyclase, partial [Oscillospiraceae bacterium]|nr:diguanylate cyclase [Oscillospiraceae bacterium]
VKNDAEVEFRDQITDVIANESFSLEAFLNSAHSEIATLADIELVKNAAQKGALDVEADDVLLRVVAENKSIQAARLANSDGRIIAGTGMNSDISDFSRFSGYEDDVLYFNDIEQASTPTMFIKRKIGSCTLLVDYNISSNMFISNLAANSAFYNNGTMILIDPRQNWTTGSGNYNNSGLTRYTSAITDRFSLLEDKTPTEIISYTDATTNAPSVAAMVRVGGENGMIALATCPVNNASYWTGKATSPIVAVAVLLAVICIAAAIVIPIMITRPLKVIEETLVKIRRGDHEARISTVSNNEYGQISRAFNNLVDEIVVSEDRYRTIIEMSDNIIFEWNFKTNEVFFSNNFNQKFSYRAPSDHFGDSFLLKAKVHPEDVDRYRDDLDKLEKGKNFERNEYRMKNIYGDFIWVLMRTATLHDKDGKPLKVVGVMVDIDRAKKSEQQLTERASYDALTELYNRETIESQIDNEIALSAARKSEMAVLFIDVDDFKHYNDNYSHATGDQVLKFVAKTIKDVVADFGFAGRYGGDEFIACVRSAEINTPTSVAQQIIQRLDEGFDADIGERLTVSVSIGIALIKDDYNTRVEYLIGKADDAMYSVKKSGKSNYAMI